MERASAGAMPTAGRSCRRSAMMFRALVHCAVVATIRKGNYLALATRENREGLLHESHRRSRWLLSNTEAPPVPFRRVLPSLLAVPSLACSVASLSLCPGGYLPDQHSLQSTGLAGCQIAWDTSSTWSGKRAQELLPLHLLVLCDRNQLICLTPLWLDGTLLCAPCASAPCAWKIQGWSSPCRPPDCMGRTF